MTSQGGSTDLPSLLKTMQPTLDPLTYLFCHLAALPGSHDQRGLPEFPKNLNIQCLFKEAEGWTLVVEEESLRRSLENGTEAGWRDEYTGGEKGLVAQFHDTSNRWRMVTLNVHSSLLAVGFIAAISAKFRDNGIPSNVVAGYFHDHIFVPLEKVDLALQTLKALSRAE